MSAFRVLWRQVRADAAALLTLAAIVLVSTAIVAALPQWLNDVDDRAIQYEFVEGQEIDDVVVRVQAPMPRDSEAFDDLATDIREQVDEPLRSVLGSQVSSARDVGDAVIVAVDNERRPPPPDLPPLYLTPRVLLGADSDLRFVEGAAPSDRTASVRGPFVGAGEPWDTEAVALPFVEVALSVDTADAVEAAVGETITVIMPEGYPVLLRVTGLFEPTDVEAYAWQRNGDVLAPTLVSGGLDGAYGEAMITAASLPAFAETRAAATAGPLTLTLGQPVDVSSIIAPMASGLLTAADRAETRRLDLPTGGERPRLDTSIQDPLNRFAGQRSTARAVGGVAVGGLLVAMIAVLALTSQLTAERRRTSLALARARGGTVRQLAGLAGVEALMIAAAAGVAGWWVGTTVSPGRPTPGSWWLVALLVVAAVAASAIIVGWEHRVVGRTQRRDLSTTKVSPKRLGAEVAAIIVAAVGVVMLRRRGLADTVVAGAVDPFMLLVPVLVALTVAIVVMRLYPIPLRLAGSVMAARPGAVGFLGITRAGRDPSGTATPLVVLLVALSFAVFSSVVANSIRVEQEATAWETVGADIRVDANESNVFADSEDIAAIAAAAGTSADHVFGVHRESTAALNTLGGSGYEFDLYLLDPVGWAAFAQSWPVDAPDLSALADAPDGSAESMPMLVSPGLASTLGSDETQFFLPGVELGMDRIGTIPSWPGLNPSGSWAIGRTTDADRAVDLPYAPSVLFIDAPGTTDASLEAVRTEVVAQQPFAKVVGRDATFALVRDAPLTQAVQLGFVLTFAVAALYCALAIVLALVVTSGARNRNLAFLRTLGLNDRQARGLVAWEILPMALITAVVGIGLGLWLPKLVGPAIDLRPFTGSTTTGALVSDGLVVAALAGGMLVVVVATTLLVAALNRRLGLGGALRAGEDG